MPYVPPHRRVGSESAVAPEAPFSKPNCHPTHDWGRGGRRGAEKRPSRPYIGIQNAKTVALRLLLDDGAERSAPGKQHFVFAPYSARSYLHLGDEPLFTLVPADVAAGLDACATSALEEATRSEVQPQDQDLRTAEGDDQHPAAPAPGRGQASSPMNGHGDGDGAGVPVQGDPLGSEAAGEEGPEVGKPLSAEVGAPLAHALERVHTMACALASSTLRRSSVEKVKMAVRLGKLLFLGDHSTIPHDVAAVPPFSRELYEASMNNRGRFDGTSVKRQLETHLEEDLFSSVEALALGPAVHRRTGTLYHIAVDDTDHMQVSYKLVCVEEGCALRIRKVENVPVRHAVVDVARPQKELDFRIMLWTETHFSFLGAETQQVFQTIASSAVVDPTANGGVTWPMGVETGASTSNGRFVVRSVRRVETVRVQSHGMSWKLRRVNGREVKLGAGGRLTNEVELAPMQWKEQMRIICPTLNKEGEWTAASNESPEWTPESLLEAVPSLLEWIQEQCP